MISYFTRPVADSERGGRREVLRVALPLIFGTAADTLMQMTDRVFLAHHSDTAFQACLPLGILSYVFLCVFHNVASYAGTFVAQYYGAGSTRGCLRATAQGLWLALFSVPFIMALIPAGVWWIRRSGLPEGVVAEGMDYFLILMLGGLRLPMAGAISGWFTGKHLLARNTAAHLAGTVLNVPLDWLFIFGCERLGIPAMGVRGAALATVISGFAPFVLLFWWYVRSADAREHGLRAAFAPDFRLMWRVTRFGLPAALQVLVDVGSFTVFVFLVGRLGGLELTAGNLCLSVNHLAFAPLMAFGFAASIIVARYQGAGEPGLASRAGWSSLQVGWCYMVPLALLFAALPRLFIAPFNAPNSAYTMGQLLAVGRPMMLMMGAWGVADCANIILMSALRGAGDTRFVMVCMTVAGWCVWLPAEWWAMRNDWGLLPMWGILAAYITGLAFVFAWRWRRGKWKTIQVIEPVLIPPSPHTEDVPWA